jgi:hypothetical protein
MQCNFKIDYFPAACIFFQDQFPSLFSARDWLIEEPRNYVYPCDEFSLPAFTNQILPLSFNVPEVPYPLSEFDKKIGDIQMLKCAMLWRGSVVNCTRRCAPQLSGRVSCILPGCCCSPCFSPSWEWSVPGRGHIGPNLSFNIQEFFVVEYFTITT